MLNRRGRIIMTAMLLAANTLVAGEQAKDPGNDTFTWIGELVSLDAPARTLTVKSRVAYEDAVSDLKSFKAGDAVWVVWSGVSNYSDAIRQFRRPEANHNITETLVMPAELVSPEAANQYVTLRVRLPEAGVAAIKNVKAGEWVTVTSRQRPGKEAEAVVAVKPYSEGAPTATAIAK